MKIDAANINAQRELARARANANQMHARADRAEQQLRTAEKEFVTANNNAAKADTVVSLTQTAQAFAQIPETISGTLNRIVKHTHTNTETKLESQQQLGTKVDILV